MDRLRQGGVCTEEDAIPHIQGTPLKSSLTYFFLVIVIQVYTSKKNAKSNTDSVVLKLVFELYEK